MLSTKLHQFSFSQVAEHLRQNFSVEKENCSLPLKLVGIARSEIFRSYLIRDRG